MTNEELISKIDLRISENKSCIDDPNFMKGDRKWYITDMRIELRGQNEALNWVKELLSGSVDTEKEKDSK